MKKLLMFLGLIGFIFFAGCEEIVEQKKDCEINDYGSVVIINKTGHPIFIDVTWGNSDYNDERLLLKNCSYEYRKVPAGSIKLWARINEIDWYYKSSYLSTCEKLTESWYLNNSSANISSVHIFDNSCQKIKN